MRSRGLAYAAGGILSLALLLELGARVGGESADERARRYLALEGPVDTAIVREAVLRHVPVGSAEAQLLAFVRGARIGRDGASDYYPAPANGGTAVIRIEEKPALLDLVTADYAILFEINTARRVQAVRVEHWLTGP